MPLILITYDYYELQPTNLRCELMLFIQLFHKIVYYSSFLYHVNKSCVSHKTSVSGNVYIYMSTFEGLT